MIISSKKRFIFLAFNKTGSTSIENTLNKYSSRSAERNARQAYKKMGHSVVFKHIRPLYLKEIVGDDVWNSYFTFCFVRNPFERLVSLYSYHRQLIPEKHPLASELSFEEWLQEGGSGSANRSMADFVSDDEGNVIIDFVGRYEQLADGFKIICERIGVNESLPQLKVTKHKDYREFYTNEARAIVESKFKHDLDMFNYSFD